MPAGRPTVYDPRKVEQILDLIADGASVDRACKKLKLRPGTFASWVARDYHGLADRFYSALRAKYLIEIDRTVDLADSVLGSSSLPQVVAAKNSGDARRFIASRLIREFHNTEHFQVDHGHKPQVVIYLPEKDPDPRVPNGRLIEHSDSREDDAADGPSAIPWQKR
jgi:hypothetical protein